MRFAVELFIDDIELEHFERQERVRRELMMELVRRLRAAGVDLPSYQQTITLRRDRPARPHHPSPNRPTGGQGFGRAAQRARS